MNCDTILNPGFEAYPEVRWWLAQGFHTDRTLEENVQKLHDMGFSACELLTLTEPSIDRQRYGWGSEEFLHDQLVIARKATGLGMGFSFTSGPDWQPAVPGLDINDEGAAQELNFTNINLAPGERYDGELAPYRHLDLGAMLVNPMAPAGPEGPNTKVPPTADELVHRFVAAVAVRICDPSKQGEIDLNALRELAPPMDFTGRFKPAPYETIGMDLDSAHDLTESVRERDGKYHLRYTAPEDGHYTVFVFWRHGTVQLGESSSERSVVISHIDRRGPEAQIDYWNRHILTEEIQRLIRDNGRVDFFQDSLEIRTIQSSGLWWSESFLREFESRRGYSLTRYLPTLIHYNVRGMGEKYGGDDAPPRFAFEGHPQLYGRLLNDYHQTLTDLYRENYLAPLRAWLNGYGIRLRAQASYGSPWVSFEMSQQQDALDFQETETLEMNDVIDYYRVHAGGVHMLRQNLFSLEMGAVGGRAYGVPLKEYLYKIHHAYAAGVNRVIMHGYAADSGPEAAVRWPGYEGIGFIFAERWGDRHPSGCMLRGFTDYLARMQAALRIGTPKVDIGILNLMYSSPKMAEGYDANDEAQIALLFYRDGGVLAQRGYTYDFFAPQYLNSFPCDGTTFDAGNTDYRALVIWQEMFPEDALDALLAAARAGLPMVVLESAGRRASGLGADARVAEAFQALRRLPSVQSAKALCEVPDALASMGILPRVSVSGANRVYTFFRKTDKGAVLYVTNADPDQTAEALLSVDGQFRPIRLNAWQGTVEATASYACDHGRTIIPVKLPPAAAQLYILEAGDELRLHGLAPYHTDLVFSREGSLLKVFAAGTCQIALSDGTERHVHIPRLPEIKVERWQLCVEDWQEGARNTITEARNGYTTSEIRYDTKKTLLRAELTELRPWKEIPEIGKEVSGIGIYTSTFTMPSREDGIDGLLIDLQGTVEMAQVYVNDSFAGYVNPTDSRMDISGHVKSGANALKIKVATMLWNRLVAMGRYPEGGVTFMSGKKIDYLDYGLTQCRLIPYKAIALD